MKEKCKPPQVSSELVVSWSPIHLVFCWEEELKPCILARFHLWQSVYLLLWNWDVASSMSINYYIILIFLLYLGVIVATCCSPDHSNRWNTLPFFLQAILNWICWHFCKGMNYIMLKYKILKVRSWVFWILASHMYCEWERAGWQKCPCCGDVLLGLLRIGSKSCH